MTRVGQHGAPKGGGKRQEHGAGMAAVGSSGLVMSEGSY
jgi:hypothetical protein